MILSNEEWSHRLILTLILGEMAEAACPSDTPNNSTNWTCDTKSVKLGSLLKKIDYTYHQELVSICIRAQSSLPQAHRPNLNSWVNTETLELIGTYKKDPKQCTAYDVIRYLRRQLAYGKDVRRVYARASLTVEGHCHTDRM